MGVAWGEPPVCACVAGRGRGRGWARLGWAGLASVTGPTAAGPFAVTIVLVAGGASGVHGGGRRRLGRACLRRPAAGGACWLHCAGVCGCAGADAGVAPRRTAADAPACGGAAVRPSRRPGADAAAGWCRPRARRCASRSARQAVAPSTPGPRTRLRRPRLRAATPWRTPADAHTRIRPAPGNRAQPEPGRATCAPRSARRPGGARSVSATARARRSPMTRPGPSVRGRPSR